MIEFVTGYLVFLFIVTVHEYAHAWTADRCGDQTARLMGRMTLDPRAHIDLLGTVLIPLSPLIFSLFQGTGIGFLSGFRFFGWAKPVPVNPSNVRRWRRDNILISFAGCASGFILAILAAVALRGLGIVFPSHLAALGAPINLLIHMISISLWLSLFNLIPVPPLDGYHILALTLRFDVTRVSTILESTGPWLLIFLINTPLLYTVLSPINAILSAIFFSGIAGL
ncbi:MAG: site-2 protease family protein [Candidatus Aureabacteria bacterium]|nr:site-2 protease family protein [Candidatus Auribacterota bacterium]